MKKSKVTPQKNNYSYSFFIFIMLIVVISNLFYSKTMDQQLEIRMFGLSLFLVLASLVILLKKIKVQITFSELTVLKNPVVIIYTFLILFTGISIIWATNQSEAIYEFLKRISLLILFLYLIFFISSLEESKSSITKAFIIFSVIISIIGFLQILKVLSVSSFNIESIYQITGNFAQKNIFSEVLFITSAFCFYGIFTTEKTWKIFAIVGLICNLLLIIFLMTRAIWVAFIISFLLTTFIYYFYLGKTEIAKSLKQISRIILIILGISIIILITVSIIDKNKTIQKQISNATNFKEGNTYHRLNLWKKSFSLSQEKPIYGVGAGNWRIEILKYDLQVFTEKGKILPDRAHNDYLQLLVENGIIGLVSYLLIFILLIYYCIITLKKSKDFKDALFILVLFFILVGYMVDSFFSFPRERIELQIFINIVYASILIEFFKIKNKDTNKVINNKISLKPMIIVFLLIVTVTSYASFKRIQSEIGVSKIYENDKKGNHDQIIKITDEIYSAYSTITPLGDPIMSIKASSLYKKNYDMSNVLNTYEEAQKDSPYHLKAFNDLAAIYLNMKNYNEATKYCNKALQYAPNDTKSIITKSKILLGLNKTEEAYNLLKNTTPNLNPIDIQNYKEILNYFLYLKMTNVISQTKNEEINLQLSKAYEKEGFLYNIHLKSIEEKAEFENILLRTILASCDKDKINNDDTIKQLKSKYKVY